MKTVDYEDGRGRTLRVLLPDDADESQADFGILVGPPPVVDALNLPEPFATQLHNELHRRGLWDANVVKKNAESLKGAIQAVVLVNAQILHEAYLEYEKEIAPSGAQEA